MRKIKIIFFVLSLILSKSARAEYVEINLISFADIYNLKESSHGSGLLSLKRIINDQKSREKNILICCSGDVLLTNGPEKREKGRPIVSILNSFNIDIASFGNHEFAIGIEELEKRISESNFKWIGSNVRKIVRDNRGNVKKAKIASTCNHFIYEIDCVRVGFFSICLPETGKLYKKECKGKVKFCDVSATAQQCIKKLKSKKADVIVALTHLDLRIDKMLSKKFPEINVILGAHDHKNISRFNGKTLIHKAGSDAAFIGKVTIRFDKIYNDIQLSWSTINNHFSLTKKL